DYIVTQMFFDNKKYFEFIEQCREAGITVPIIPGIKVLTTKKQLTVLPKTFHIDIPGELQDEVEKCATDKEVKEVGIEWCINQTKELKKSGAPCLHFYTMGNSDSVRRVASEVF
ncbi:MAG: methylenetetrahydrofolate reductase, partial [Bacteroidia bacterium]|nr:methylenetetrahydrofolate reductase [Bacteroidia bacterium]